MKKSESSKLKISQSVSELETVTKPAEPEKFLIVGIGASAGGIQALKEFFENVSANSGMAYVVILHLSPDHDSQLADVLQATAPIPVTQVTERIQVEPDHVYVVPPNQHLGMEDGHLVVSPNLSVEERRAPVDIFFRTLAESHHARAVAIILSGTGANGSMGIKRIKEGGGAAFVQNPREAEFSEMPRNSIATDLIDAVLNVSEIPAKILAYKEKLGTVAIPAPPESRPENDSAALREIFSILRARTGHDFSNYKRSTVIRRIERRINVSELTSLPAYAAFLKKDLDEAQSLLKDLLISVTNFFRDKQAFQFLEQTILPGITANKTSKDEIRMWAAGCATGEEAYSLAILLAEQIEATSDSPAIQIFASDIDEAAIATAREGFYTTSDVADVSPERLRRFFYKDGDGYRVRRELREMILFANHNVLKDPPFSHLDLVTCRNLLIYFNSAAQERVMETFHFALKPGSYLFLGTSESIDGAGDLYAAVSKEHHVYQSRQATAKIAYPVPDTPFGSRSAEQRMRPPSTARKSQEQENRVLERISFGDLHQQMLEQYAPPSIVVNENYDIVHLSEHAGRFLQVGGGEPSKNLLHLIRPELRLELRTALYQSVQRQSNVSVANVPVQINGDAELINLQVRPVLRQEDTARGFLLVLFEPALENGLATTNALGRITAVDESLARELEKELERTKTQLRTTAEQYEIQTEELRASNEELQAMNEELRSTTEELETSREELQSVNEELLTVNQELKIKIEELSNSNNDFQNLLNSTDIGTIFLDLSLRIKMFTPSARGVFNLIEADLNRPLSDITAKFDFANLHQDVETVLDNLQTVEREFATNKGQWYLMRIFPYRTFKDHVNGVVVTFFDITERRLAEEARRESEDRMRLLIESATDFAIIAVTPDNLIDSWNTGAETLFGYPEAEIIGESATILFTPEDRGRRVPEQEIKTARKQGRAEDERWHIRKDNSRFYASGVMMPLKDGKGFVKIARNMTDKIAAQNALRDKEMLQRMIGAQEDERRRIARDMHDQLGQQLTALRLKLESTRKLCEDSPICDKIDELQLIAKQIDADADFLAWELRPAALDDLGLLVALDNYVREWSKHSGIAAEFHASGLNNSRLAAEIETNVYRITQEALNNSYKHAKAERTDILLEKRDGSIVLIIEDDGAGFDPEDKMNRSKGIGLIGMKERAELVGGTLEIESAPGEGTTIFVRVPASFVKK